MNSDLGKLSRLMRDDWDRRVGHDYRFWMSDGYASDEAMWTSGERDFEILTKGISGLERLSVLELGCGVGRILKAGLPRCQKLIGIDVSERAIGKARDLIGSHENLQLIVGNGIDIHQVPDESVDVVLSFAALCSIPTDIVARYLCEIHRVLRSQGVVRMQLYIGREQASPSEDTLHLRCYDRRNLEHALQLSGFAIESIDELVLPIQVSFKELGIEAVVLSLKKLPSVPAEPDTISQSLLPGGEPKSEPGAQHDLEYWMTINYARELAEGGESEKARRALEHAALISKTTVIDVGDILNRIVKKLDEPASTNSQSTPSSAMCFQGGPFFEANMAILERRFPEVARRVLQWRANHSGSPNVTIRATPQGPVMYYGGQCLDHPDKPLGGAESWARRVYQEGKGRNAKQFAVVGCGSGYHLGALAQLMQASNTPETLVLLEPRMEVFASALETVNCGEWLNHAEQIFIEAPVSLKSVRGEYELIVRPQTQSMEPDYCAELRSQYYGRRGLSVLHPTIGISGPLQGGTLPMLDYVDRGLRSLHQRSRPYDVSGFCPGYHELAKFVREPLRRRGIENTYCEMLSQVVLESVNEKPVDIVICLAQAPLSPRVLTELRSRGIITVLWFVEDYARFTYWKEMSRYFDFVFTIQKGKCIEAIRSAGAGEVHYLPVGCDPIVHTPLTLSEDERRRWGSPISFMGAGYHNRQQLFASMAEYPLKIWGTEWPDCKPFDRLVQEGGRRLSPDEYMKVFNATDININLHSSHERDGVDPFGDFLNPRTFELAAAGVFQLVDKRSLLAEAFEEGAEMVTFSNVRDLREKIDYYLSHPDERIAIAQRAQARALREHTYGHRVQKMLSVIYSSRFEQLKARQDASPWQRMLDRAKPHGELHQRCQKAFERGEEANLDGLVSDIVVGQGKMTETERKLMFLYHVKKQIIRLGGRDQEVSGS